MEQDLPPLLSFDALRRVAIKAAQDASGDSWTDYNTHDPGVTLLEQTLYAATEIAYRADHPVRDLLTRSDGVFDASRLGLFPPIDVLPGRPVTLHDLGRCLSHLPEVDRVFVRPAPETGLVDFLVIPSAKAAPEDAIEAVRHAHGQARLIGSDTGRIHVAHAHPVRIEAQIAIDALARPERVAAEVLHRVLLVLHGHSVATEGDEPEDGSRRQGALRRAVFDDPARVWPEVGADALGAAEAEAALAVIGRAPGIVSIESFRLIDPATGLPPSPELARFGTYLNPVLPTAGDRRGIFLTRDGEPVPFDPDLVAEEVQRLVAHRIAESGNQLDKADWHVDFAGRSRSFERAPLDSHLPAIYRTGQADPGTAVPARPGEPGPAQAMAVLKSFRAMTERHLDEVVAPLAELPHRFAAVASLPDVHDGAALRARREVLDYLIALQGEEMPRPLPAALHAGRTAGEVALWEVAWRESYLARLADYDHWSGTAHPDFGFAARLTHLADLSLAGPDGVPRAAAAEGHQGPVAGTPFTSDEWALHDRGLETVTLVEDIRLRRATGGGGAFVPGLVHAFFPGYTMRTSDPGYRRYVEALIETFAPAHVLVHPHWLAPSELVDLRAALSRAMPQPDLAGVVTESAVASDGGAALREFVARLERAPT
jgi:hypothetical protein